MGSKNTKPKIRFQGIQAIKNRSGVWKFRARSRRIGKVHYGPLRLTQEQAAEDYLVQTNGSAAAEKTIDTLGEALRAVIAAAERRGVKPTTLRGQLQSHARFLLRYWEADSPLRKFAEDDILWFIKEARTDGRHVNTLIEKDLPLLSQAFAIAHQPNPVPGARKKANIKKAPRTKVYVEYAEALRFIERMRTEVLRDRRGRTKEFRRRGWHADLVAFLLYTGARNGELANLRVEDISETEISFDAKTGPRTVAVHSALTPITERLIEDARANGRDEIMPTGNPCNLTQLISRWSKRLGMKVHARALRHTLAFAMLDTPRVSLADVQAQLGHSLATTTDQYLKQQQRSNASPLEKVNQHFGPPSEPGAQLRESGTSQQIL